MKSIVGITGTYYQILVGGITCTCHNWWNRFRDGLAQSGEPTAAMELSDMGPDLRWCSRSVHFHFLLWKTKSILSSCAFPAEGWRASPGWSFPRQLAAVFLPVATSTQTPPTSLRPTTGPQMMFCQLFPFTFFRFKRLFSKFPSPAATSRLATSQHLERNFRQGGCPFSHNQVEFI